MSTPLREILSRTLGGFNDASEEEKEEMIQGFMDDKEAQAKVFGSTVGGWENFSPDERDEVSAGIFREDREIRQKSLEEQQRIAADDAFPVEYPLERAGEAVRDLRPIDAATDLTQWGLSALGRGVAGMVPKAQKAVGFVDRAIGKVTGSADWEKSGQEWNRSAEETQRKIDETLPPGTPDMMQTGIGLESLPLNVLQGADAAVEMIPDLAVMGAATKGAQALGMAEKTARIAGPAAVMAPGSITKTADVIEQKTGNFSPGTAIAAGSVEALLWSGAFQRLLKSGVDAPAAKRMLEEMSQKGQWGRIAQIGAEAVKGAGREAGKMGIVGTGANLIEQTVVKAEGGKDPISLSEAVEKGGAPAALTGLALGFQSGMSEAGKVYRDFNMRKMPTLPEAQAKNFAEQVFKAPGEKPIVSKEEEAIARLSQELDGLKFERDGIAARIEEARAKGESIEDLEIIRKDLETRINQRETTISDIQTMQEGQQTKTPFDFISTPEGKTDFGLIDEGISKIAGISVAPIRLQEGRHDSKTNKGFGKVHIQEQRGNQVKSAGFNSVEEFVEAIVGGWNQLYQSPKGRLLLVKRNGKEKMASLELRPEKDGFYTIVTAHLIDAKKNIKGKLLLDRRGEPGSSGLGPTSPSLAETPPAPGGNIQESASSRSGVKSSSDQNITQPPVDVKKGPDDGRQFFDQSAGKIDYRDISQTPPDLTITTPVKRSDIVRIIKEKIFPWFQGRMNAPKGVQGWYNQKGEYGRGRDAKNIEVASHEAGHHLSKKLGITDADLAPFQQELLPISSPDRSGKPTLQEGLAEFVRYYVTDPAKASQKAPTFLAEFQKRLAGNKEFNDAIHEVRGAWENYVRQSPEGRILGNLDLHKPETITEKVSRMFRGLPELYTAVVDEFEPIRKMQEAMAKGTLPNIWESPYELMRLSRGVSGKVASFIWNKPFEFANRPDRIGKDIQFKGKSLAEILEPMTDKQMEFRAYLVAAHARDLAGRVDKHGDPAPIETGIRIEDADAVYNKYHNQFGQAAKDLYEYQGNVLNYAVDAGLLSAGDAARMRQKNQNYIPLQRIMGDIGDSGHEYVPAGNGKGFEIRKKVVSGLKGSTRDIIDPLESIVRNTFKFIDAAEKNTISRAIANLGMQEGNGAFVRKIPNQKQAIRTTLEQLRNQLSLPEKVELDQLSPDLLEKTLLIFRQGQTPKNGVLPVWKNGKMELFEVHPEIERVMKSLDAQSANIYWQLLAEPARWLRAGATLTPEFSARNLPMDTLQAALFSKYQMVPGVDLVRSLIRGTVETAKQGEVYWRWMASGGGGAELTAVSRPSIYQELNQVMQNPRGIGRYTNLVTSPIKMLEALSQFSERITRLGEFSLGLEKEGQTAGGMMRAALASRDVSLDFARAGWASKGLNQIVAFHNAAIQGVDKFINGSREMFRKDPALMAARVGAYLVLPTLYLWQANKDDPRYQDVEQVVKDTHWIYISGPKVTRAEWEKMPEEQRAKMIKDTMWRIPKPREMGLVFSSFFERMLNRVWEKDEHAFDGFVTESLKSITPPILPTAAVPVGENLYNKSTWTGQALESPNVEKRMPAERYGPWTSKTSRAIGRLTNLSPIKIDNLIRGYTGRAGQYATDITDKIGGLTGALPPGNDPEQLWADTYMVRGFSHRPERSEFVRRFGDQFREAEQRYNSIQFLRKKGEVSRAQELAFEGTWKKLTSIQKELSDIMDDMNKVRDDPKMAPEKKRTQMLILQNRRSAVAYRGTKIYDELRKKSGK